MQFHSQFLKHIFYAYQLYFIYLDRQAWANNIDPDQIAPKEQFHQGLQFLSLHVYILDQSPSNQIYSNFRSV